MRPRIEWGRPSWWAAAAVVALLGVGGTLSMLLPGDGGQEAFWAGLVAVLIAIVAAVPLIRMIPCVRGARGPEFDPEVTALAQERPSLWSTPSPNEAVAVTAADPVLVDQLGRMREEERLARDLYQLFADAYGQAQPFANITRSEQRHFDAVGKLLETYGIPDPAAGLPAGTYAFPELQALYDDWAARGAVSQLEAAKVGVELETRDIADLEAAIAASAWDDVTTVLGRLKNGSEHHLAAFTDAAGGTFDGGHGNDGQQGGGHGSQPGMPAGGQGHGGQQGAGRPDQAGDAGTTEGRPGRHFGMGGTHDPATRPSDCPNADGEPARV